MIKTALLITGILLVGYPIAWVLASRGVFGDVEFGYYAGFNAVRHAIERSQCAAEIECGGVNKDIVLEEFHFKVTDPWVQMVRLWFDDSNMDVRRLCSQPTGLIVWNRNCPGDTQVYSMGLISKLLDQTDHTSPDWVANILCNVDVLRRALRTIDGDANEVLAGDPYCWDYLRIDFPTEQDLRAYRYMSLNDRDELSWPQ